MSRVVSFEMSSKNPEIATNFYSTVFGWRIANPNWGYYPVTTGDNEKLGINGGIASGGDDFPLGTRIQIEVDNIDEAIRKSKQMGAQVLKDKIDFDDFYLAYLVDPVGIAFGLIQHKK